MSQYWNIQQVWCKLPLKGKKEKNILTLLLLIIIVYIFILFRINTVLFSLMILCQTISKYNVIFFFEKGHEGLDLKKKNLL